MIGQIISIRKVLEANWNLSGKHGMKLAITTVELQWLEQAWDHENKF